MANIKISIDAPILPAGSGLTHVSTDWVVSRYPDFTNRDYYVLESLGDTTNLTSIFYNSGDYEGSLYCKVKYTFNNGLSSEWSRTIPVRSDQIGLKLSSTVIITPNVEAKLIINNTDKVLEINTTDMVLYSGVGNHVSTTWVIVDLNGNEVFRRDEDSFNLTNLSINADILDSDKIFQIKVKYHTDTNAISNYGKTFIDTDIVNNNVFDIKLINNPYINSDVYASVILYEAGYRSTDLIFKDVNGLTIKVNLDQETLTPIINTTGMNIYDVYTIEARIRFTNGVTTPYHVVWEGRLKDNAILPKDTTATYVNDYTFTQELLLKGATVETTIEMPNGDILLTKHNDNNIYYYNTYGDTILEKGIAGSLSGSDDMMDKQFINIRPLKNGNVLVDYLAVSEVHSGSPLYADILASGTNGMVTLIDDGLDTTIYAPRFVLFSYNPITHTLTNVNEVKRTDEDYSTSVTNSIAVIDNFMYYIPALMSNDADLVIKRVNIDTLDIEVVDNLPVSGIKSYANLAYVNDNTLLIAGGSNTPYLDSNNIMMADRINDNVYNYNISTKTYTQVSTLPTLPNDMYALQTIVLRNYDIAFFNAVYSGESLGNQDTYIFNNNTETFTTYNNDTVDGMAYRTNVRLRNGDLLRISSRTVDPQLVYLYPIVRVDPLVRVDNTSVDLVLDLVVAPNETITVNDLYRYETVDIQGTSLSDTGILRWQNGDSLEEFNYLDLIITRDTTMTSDETANYERITVLDGAHLTIV